MVAEKVLQGWIGAPGRMVSAMADEEDGLFGMGIDQGGKTCAEGQVISGRTD